MILVTGATGFIGRHLIRDLMAQGLPVRCLLPPFATKHLPWDVQHPHAPHILTGTILDAEATFRAVTGVHTIIHLSSAQWWGRQRDLERIEVGGTRNLVAQARAARVGRIITLSHIGASPASAYTLLRVKGQVEEIIKNSGLAYTIIRSGLVFGEEDAFINHIAMLLSLNPLFFLMPGRGEVVLHPIYIQDLVSALIHSLETLEVVDHVVEIGGAEYTTLEDMLRTVMRVTGLYRPLVPTPPYLLRWLTAFFSFILPRSAMTAQWLDVLATNRSTRLSNAYDYFGIRPRRFEDTLVTYLPKRRHFWALLRYTFRRRPRRI